MTKAVDVARALTNLHTKIAKDLDDAPTGVKPGYSAALGGTVLPSGKIRYVRAGGSLPFLLRYRTGASGTGTIVDNTEARLDFHDIDQDDNSYVTIGASWKFEPPSDGWYAVTFWIRWSPSGGDISAGGNFDMTWWRSGIQEAEIYKWTSGGTVAAGYINTIAFRAVLYFQATYDINFRLDNDIGQTLAINTDSYIAIERIGDPTP